MRIAVPNFIYLASVFYLSSRAVESEVTEHFLKLGKAACLQTFQFYHTNKIFLTFNSTQVCK
jgi:hypothetical protein